MGLVQLAGSILAIETGVLADLLGPIVSLFDGRLGVEPGLLGDVLGLGLTFQDQLVGRTLALGPPDLGLLEQLIGALAGLLEGACGLATVPLRLLDLGGDPAPKLL
jgi:hypothetical protein